MGRQSMLTANSGVDSPPATKSRARANRDVSFNTERREMGKKLASTQSVYKLKSVWFVAGALMMFGLYL